MLASKSRGASSKIKALFYSQSVGSKVSENVYYSLSPPTILERSSGRQIIQNYWRQLENYSSTASSSGLSQVRNLNHVGSLLSKEVLKKIPVLQKTSWDSCRQFTGSSRRLLPSRGVESETVSRGQKVLKASQEAGAKRSKAMVYYLVALVLAMVGATYAAVPLYRMFCQATGFGGTVQRRETVEEKIARHADNDPKLAARMRELVIHFNADVADDMPWRFLPSQREVKVHPGQSTLAFYTAHNLSKKPITGISTYNVTPMKAAAYFNKIQCFCFEEQRLRAGEKVDMPVFFYIDPKFATDPKMKDVKSLTLSYTFFRVDDEEEVST